MNYRLLAVDMDDTLLPREGGISDRSKTAIRRAQDEGIMVTLASGRTFSQIQGFSRELGIDLPLIAHQGALIKDQVTGHVLHEDLVPREIIHDVVSFCREHDLHLNVYVDDEVFMERSSAEYEVYSAISRKAAQDPVPDLIAVLDRSPSKFLVVSATPELSEATLPVLKEHFGDRLSILRSHPLLIEGVTLTASKGRALAILAGHLNVAQAETAAIGDNENDVEMLTWAGLGLAMGNAAPPVQAAADLVLPSISEDGAAYGIERYVLDGRGYGD